MKVILTISEYSPLALFWMVKAFTLDWVLRQWSFFLLKSDADRFGLKYIKSDYIKEFGHLQGRINGYKVSVVPDNHMTSRVTVELNGKIKGLDLNLSKPHLWPEKKVKDFRTGDWKFDLTFKTKRIDYRLENMFVNNSDLIKLINDFYYKWMIRLDSFVFSENEIFCDFKYSLYFFPYIPSWRVGDIVSEMAAIAGAVDGASGGKGL
ncbi:MAG TPA: hypothetical protein PK906_12455 [Spirochaetota bacterium]|nr:hypothetical protein [Spirochaetota bacterium]